MRGGPQPGSGRRSRCTPTIVEPLLNAISGGAYQTTACAYVGINPATLDLWNRRGRREIERAEEAGIDTENVIQQVTTEMVDGRVKPRKLEDMLGAFPKGFLRREWPYVVVFHQVEKAKAVAEIRNLTIIQSAAPENWQAAGWILERTHPERYGRRERINLEGSKDGSAVSVEVSSVQALEARIEALRKENG